MASIFTTAEKSENIVHLEFSFSFILRTSERNQNKAGEGYVPGPGEGRLTENGGKIPGLPATATRQHLSQPHF